LLIDVWTGSVVPSGVVTDHRTTDAVTGLPGSVNGSDTHIPYSGLKAVVAVAVVEVLPVVFVTAVEVDSVAAVAVVVMVGAVVAVMDTSAAGLKNMVAPVK
jgi:hypothetical protein